MTFFRKIPFVVQPIFWIFAAIIGFLNSGTFQGTLLWVVIIFLSVLIHEFGHALVALFFGQKPKIALVALGGQTSYDGKKLSKAKEFSIVFAGPFFGFLLVGISLLLLKLPFPSPVISFLKLLYFVNIFWSIVNLLPVLPLDGGQLLRIVCEALFGGRGLHIALWIGMVIAMAISLLFFVLQSFLAGALFFLFAFQSFEMWRKTKFLSSADREEKNQKLFHEGEVALHKGDKKQAKEIFEKLRRKTSQGMLFARAIFLLAKIEKEEGKLSEAYQLLLTIEPQLTGEGLFLLQKLAFEEKDYALSAKLSVPCYQHAPTEDCALLNARAFAHLKQGEMAGGWLQRAFYSGKIDRQKVLAEEVFLALKEDPLFRKFLEGLQS